jgi:hypothetical protein
MQSRKSRHSSEHSGAGAAIPSEARGKGATFRMELPTRAELRNKDSLQADLLAFKR